MIDISKIKLMHELAPCRENEQRSGRIANSYFRIDYITKHMVGMFISYTLCFMLVFALIIVCDISKIIDMVKVDNILDPYKPYIRVYLIGLGIIELITIVVYAYRYTIAKKRNRMYIVRLERLNRKYEKDGSVR